MLYEVALKSRHGLQLRFAIFYGCGALGLVALAFLACKVLIRLDLPHHLVLTTDRCATILIMTALAALLVPPMVFTLALRNRIVRNQIDACVCFWCQYSLDGLIADRGWYRCPECGKLSPATMDVFD